MVQLCEAQPDLSGNPFLWLEKPRQKDWERKADKLYKRQNIKSVIPKQNIKNN